MPLATPEYIDSSSPERTRELGRLLGEHAEGGDVIALSGPLGAGKTCLVQGLARGLGVPESVPVTSPTFGLVHQYPGRLELRHADFYRLEGYTRLADAGFDDLLDERGVVVVEWPERCWEALPDERLEIELEIVSGTVRRIWLRARGPRPEQLCRRVRAQWR
jgi:tRNA threonylcarbamoyladenosine biosynthesis protein TsaE